MSNPLSSEKSIELRRLVQLMHDKRITQDERTRLEEWLQADEEARKEYVQYMHLYARVLWDHRKRACDTEEPCFPIDSPSSAPPVLGWLADVFRSGMNHLSRPFALTLLVALFLPGIILLVLALDVAHQPISHQPTAPQVIKVPVPATIAQFTRSHECVWAGDGAQWPVGSQLYPGQKLKLKEGVAELTYADGARLLLRGPSTFQINSGGGQLHLGSLTATVPKAASGFQIETPLATMVDLGTEFGVFVGANGTSEAHVFKGRVQVVTDVTSKSPTPLESQLTAGQGARIRVGSTSRGRLSIEPIAASSAEFVRRFPAPKPKNIAPYSPLIHSVNRKGGMGYDGIYVDTLGIRPTTTFDGETDPFPPNESGIDVDAKLYSDREYAVTRVDKPLMGANYVRMFNTDKENPNKFALCTYDVTFENKEKNVFIMLIVDDRLAEKHRQRQLVDGVVARFAKPGDFIDTGYDIEVMDHAENRVFSVFGMLLPTCDDSGKRITYTFKNKSLGYCTHIIAVMEEPPVPIITD